MGGHQETVMISSNGSGLHNELQRYQPTIAILGQHNLYTLHNGECSQLKCKDQLSE